MIKDDRELPDLEQYLPEGDGRLVVPYDVPFNIRKAGEMAIKLGRPLTDEELKPFLYKK